MEIKLYNWEGKNILVAEDEDTNFNFIDELLSTTNANVFRAKNGVEVFEQMEKNPDIAVVIMDIKMPKMDGVEATKILKGKTPNIPVIALTAYAHQEEKNKMIEAGCDDFIVKPLDIDDFLNKVDKFIG